MRTHFGGTLPVFVTENRTSFSHSHVAAGLLEQFEFGGSLHEPFYWASLMGILRQLSQRTFAGQEDAGRAPVSFRDDP